MTRSIFDPGGGETERSGSTHMGPDADNRSRMPPDATDGEVPGDDEATVEGVDRADSTPAPLAPNADEAARRLRDMTSDETAMTGE